MEIVGYMPYNIRLCARVRLQPHGRRESRPSQLCDDTQYPMGSIDAPNWLGYRQTLLESGSKSIELSDVLHI